MSYLSPLTQRPPYTWYLSDSSRRVSHENQLDMPPKRVKREYRGNSCHRCHHQKIKCSRGKFHLHSVSTASDKRTIERPCWSCTLANRPCTYAVRDRQVTISESYLKNLEDALAESGPSSGAKKRHVVDLGHAPQDDPVGRDTETTPVRRPLDPLVENSTVEVFVSKLKQIPKLKHSPGTLGSQTASSPSYTGELRHEPTKSQLYEYFALNYDTSRMFRIDVLVRSY